MPAHQFLKHINVSVPHTGHKGRIGILGKRDIGDGTGPVGEKIQIFWTKNLPGREICRCPDACLQSVQEVGQSRHHNRLDDLALGKTLRAKSLRLKPLA